jgi:hypothetical protein
MRDAHHCLNLSDRHASRVQGGVDLVGDLFIGPTPPEIVADEPPHPDEGVVVLGRPGEADGTQLGEVSVVKGTGDRARRTSNQGRGGHHGDDQSGQPPGCGHLTRFFLRRRGCVSVRVESGANMKNSESWDKLI